MNYEWFLSGVYYGYPSCCIEEFILYSETGAYLERETRKLSGTGYVPCTKCNQKSEDELVKIINGDRLHWQKFPKDGPNKKSFVNFSRWVAEMFLENSGLE